MKKLYHEGMIFLSSYGTKVVLVKRLDYKRCVLRVENTDVEFMSHLTLLPSGKFKTPYCKTTYGVGYMGSEGAESLIHSPVHRVWSNMIKRCYTDYKGNRSQNVYSDTFVEKPWHNFSIFSTWYLEREKLFLGTNIKPKLDKDLLGGSDQIYSEKTCCLIPHTINCALIERKKRGNLPLGVLKHKKGYSAKIMVESCEKVIGICTTSEEASRVYISAKKEVIKQLAHKYRDVLEEHVYHKLINWEPKRIF